MSLYLLYLIVRLAGESIPALAYSQTGRWVYTYYMVLSNWQVSLYLLYLIVRLMGGSILCIYRIVRLAGESIPAISNCEAGGWVYTLYISYCETSW